MAATSTRTISTVFSGDVNGTETQNAATNGASPACITVQNLASGNNTITPPSANGVTLQGVTIVPPVGNAVGLTLKGVGADTGIVIHKTDPTSLGLDSSVAAFVLGAANTLNNVRFFWT